MADLVVLVPDGAYHQVLRALLRRHMSIGIRPVSFQIVTDPYHDSSLQAVEWLRPFQSSHQHALVIRDLEGCGHEQVGASALERRLVEQLIASGWQRGRASALVLDPELECWLRFGSSHMGRVLAERARKNRDQCNQWKARLAAICENHGGVDGLGKPVRPKEVFGDLLRTFGVPPSNAVLGVLAQKESLQDCKDEKFLRFRDLMRHWFPPP